MQPIDTTELAAEIARLQAQLDAALAFNAALNGQLFDTPDNVTQLSRGQKIAASRKANREAEEARQAEQFERRSAAMRKSWAKRKRTTKAVK
jgi:hypothetical protein